jgi:hypothetical protein
VDLGVLIEKGERNNQTFRDTRNLSNSTELGNRTVNQLNLKVLSNISLRTEENCEPVKFRRAKRYKLTNRREL